MTSVSRVRAKNQATEGIDGMALSRPTFVIWTIATLLAATVIAMRYASVEVPVISPIVSGNLFEVLLVSFALLWAGTVFKGI